MQNIYPADAAAALQRPSPGVPAAQGAGEAKGFGFLDLIDVVNPLHHIPVIGRIYRKLSGDTINPVMRIGGGALFGGPLGAAFAASGLVLEQLVDDAGAGRAMPPVDPGSSAAPGGWMVAASRPVRPEQRPPQSTPGGDPARLAETVSTPRRGGWMAAAAYAMTDELTAGRAKGTHSSLSQLA